MRIRRWRAVFARKLRINEWTPEKWQQGRTEPNPRAAALSPVGAPVSRQQKLRDAEEHAGAKTEEKAGLLRPEYRAARWGQSVGTNWAAGRIIWQGVKPCIAMDVERRLPRGRNSA
jgi:hypothetical protein